MKLNELLDGVEAPGGRKTRGRKLTGEHRQLLRLLSSRFSGPEDRETCCGFVPGRIEVFGRHTDYAGGRSLVCALDRGFLFVAAPNEDGLVRMCEDSGPEFEPLEFPLTSSLTPSVGSWANYPMTMARRLVRNFQSEAPLTGVDVVFSSTLPVGSGMSGSSALMMMTFAAIATLNRLDQRVMFREALKNPMDLSVYLACAENGQGFKSLEGDRGVGTFGGSEDHAAILNGRPGMLSLFGFRPASLLDEIPWPKGWRMVVAFSGVRAEKTREALEKYNLASRRAREAVERYNRLFGVRLLTLREVADHVASRKQTDWREHLDAADGGSAPGLSDRIRQFVLEDRRYIPQAVGALRAENLPAFGKALTASHNASRKYLWNIAPEIDFLQKSALHLGAAGASGFGAGFGGSIFAVLPKTEAKAFLAGWRAHYGERYPQHDRAAAFFPAEPDSGIELLEPGGPVRLVDRMFGG